MVPNEKQVCPQNNAIDQTYLCETRGSETLVWRSPQLIGLGGKQIQFASFETLGTTKRSKINPYVEATLIKTDRENGVRILKCNLSITLFNVSSFEEYSIVCLNTGLDTENNLNVEVNGMYLFMCMDFLIY